MPPPTKKPLRCCQVRPAVARVSFSVFEIDGATELSIPTISAGRDRDRHPDDGTTPFNSSTPRSGLREG